MGKICMSRIHTFLILYTASPHMSHHHLHFRYLKRLLTSLLRYILSLPHGSHNLLSTADIMFFQIYILQHDNPLQ